MDAQTQGRNHLAGLAYGLNLRLSFLSFRPPFKIKENIIPS